MLRILILSDIHMLSMAQERDPNYELRKKLLRDIKDYRDCQGVINHILVSGDIAFKGAKEEYNLAQKFFQDVCYASGCSEEEIYVIPGNHDKDFCAPNAAFRHLIHAGLAHSNTDSDDRFNDLLAKEFIGVKLLYQPFKNYHNFAVKYDSFEPIMHKCLDENEDEEYNNESDKVFMKRKLGSLNGYDIYLYGMNTALNSDWFDITNEGKGHKLFLSNLAYNADCEYEGRINIAMMHHPLDHILNGNEIQKVIDKKFQIQIFGHLHKPASDSNNSVHILSGALQPPINGEEDKKWYFSVYNILELDIESKEQALDVLKVKLQVEKYNGQDFEHNTEDSRNFEIELVKPHINRWEQPKMQKRQVVEGQQLPKGVSVRKVRFAFLQNPNPIKYMKHFGKYAPEKTENENCIIFLKQMEADNRLNELWIELNK